MLCSCSSRYGGLQSDFLSLLFGLITRSGKEAAVFLVFFEKDQAGLMAGLVAVQAVSYGVCYRLCNYRVKSVLALFVF